MSFTAPAARSIRNIHFIAAVLLLLTICGCAALPPKPYVKANSIRPGKMAILPFENLTNHDGAGREFDDSAPIIFAQYTPMKIASPDAIQEAMKTQGKASSLTRYNLKSLRGALGVDYVMVGTVYEFAAGESPAIFVGVRVLDAKNGDTLWALRVTKKGRLLDTGSVHTLAITVIEEIARSFNESVSEERGKENGSSEVPVSAISGEGEEKQETGAKAAAGAPVAPPEAAAQPKQREAAREAAVVAEKKQPEIPAASSAPVVTPETTAQPEQREAAKETAVVAEKPLKSQSAAIDQKKAIAAVPETPVGEMPVKPAEKPRNDATEAIAPSPPALTLTVRVMTRPKQPERIEKSDGGLKATSTDAPAKKDTEESGKGVTHKVAAAMTVEAATCPEGPLEVKSASSGPLPELVIIFETDKSLVKPAYHGQIAKIAAFLKSNPATYLYIEGHADYLGSVRYNLALSQKRADGIKGHLQKSLSVAPSRITAKGVGCSQPVAENITPEGREKNRRAVIYYRNQRGK